MNQKPNSQGRVQRQQGGTQNRRPMTPEQQAAARKAAQQRAQKQREDARQALAREEKQKQKLAREREKQRRRAQEQKRRAEEKMRRHDERFELTEEERAIRAQMKREERQYRSRQRARRAKIFFGRCVMFCIMFVCLLGISIGLFYVNLVKYEMSARRDFSYKVGTASSVTVPYEQMVRGGTLYVNMTPIVSMCGLAVTGDTAELRYISRNGREHVQFIVGSTQVFINGVEERLTAAPYLIGEDLYVPASFFSSFVTGISVNYNKDTQSVSVTQTPLSDGSAEMQQLRFVIRSNSPLISLNEFNEFGNTPPIAFTADLSLYEEYMNPKDRDAYLLLVNEQYPLPQSYVPDTVEIVDIRLDGRPLQYLDFTAERAAHAMIMELASNGFSDVNILLGYRSYSKQRNYFETVVADYMKTMTEEQARIAASSIAQKAGCNPQQAGTSIIMHNLEDTTTAFSREAAYAWLAENCWKFGYIIRYPADKTAETGMAFQPYFFTFVGRYHAMRIMESGLSMEEYVMQLEAKNYFGTSYEQFRNGLIENINK
ncbi:MAG: D-alanyl-D-alanine carboxypeptidase family protein [Clostridia bacterium]|nr:D-alanyl-D-alanine carboxypeptidase family protein [Clostridia bacterium]